LKDEDNLMNAISDFSFLMPTKVIFGLGKFDCVGTEASLLGKKALIVTGRNAMRKLGVTDKALKLLGESRVEFELFDQVESNPDTEKVEAGVRLALEKGCDLVIGIGGGSVIDAAKAIASSAGLKIPILELMKTGALSKGLPCIVIPTTSGTGAEVTLISVLTIKEKKRKDALRGVGNYPNLAIVDPQLTLQLTPYITADTGIDALTHAIEAYTSRRANPVADLFARKAIGLVSKSLRRAVYYGEDLVARTEMARASHLAGLAISQAGTGGAHGFGMTIGGICNTDHGVTVGLLLPAIMKLNLGTNLEKFADIAQLMGENTSGLSLHEAANLACESVSTLLRDIGLPDKLSQIGVTKDLFSEIIADTKTQNSWSGNPKPVSEDEMKQVMESLK
jgi:alcohol dehydrogenase class IV